jgi:hypothetical protein
MITPPKNNKVPKINRKAQMQWRQGLVTTGGRMDTPEAGMFQLENAVMNQTGTIRSRYPFRAGSIPNIPGVFTAPIYSYWNPDKQKFNVLCVSDHKMYFYDTDNDDWTQAFEPDGAVDFADTQIISYCQYQNMIVCADSVNQLAYFNTLTGEIVRPGAVIEENPQLAIAGSNADPTDYRAYYLVSYINDFGETPASGGSDFISGAQKANILLEDENQPLGKWSTPLQITITPATMPAGTRCRIYRVVTPDFLQPTITSFQLVKEFEVNGAVTFEDDGTVIGRVVSPQLENSTGGLTARLVTELDGRIWAFGAGKEFQKMYYTGSAPTESIYPQFFSGDGGYFYIAYGSSFEPVTIKRGRADDGQICNFVLCSGPDGIGRRFNIFSLQTEYGNQVITHFYPSEQKGDEGAYSMHGVIDYMNSILYPSPGGFKSSGIRATYTGDNVTAVIDNNIRDTVQEIPYETFKKMYGAVYNGRAMWSLSPADIIVFDAKNNGAWSTWRMPHDWFGALSVGSDRIALYVVSDGAVLRYADTEDFRGRDELGPEYPVVLKSGRLMANPEDGRQWTRMLHVLFVFSDLYGPIRIKVRANTRKRLEIYTGEVVVDMEKYGEGDTAVSGTTPVPWSDAEAHENVTMGSWSQAAPWSSGPLHVMRDPSSGLVEVRINIKKDVNFLDWEIESLPGFIGLQLREVVEEFVDIGVGLDFSSRYNEVRVQTRRG